MTDVTIEFHPTLPNDDTFCVHIDGGCRGGYRTRREAEAYAMLHAGDDAERTGRVDYRLVFEDRIQVLRFSDVIEPHWTDDEEREQTIVRFGPDVLGVLDDGGWYLEVDGEIVDGGRIDAGEASAPDIALRRAMRAARRWL